MKYINNNYGVNFSLFLNDYAAVSDFATVRHISHNIM